MFNKNQLETIYKTMSFKLFNGGLEDIEKDVYYKVESLIRNTHEDNEEE